jgi:hypothetical protein
MQSQQQLAVMTASTGSPCPERQMAFEKGGFDSSPTKRKQCTQQCLRIGRGLSFEEKNCLLDCYQRTNFPIRKILSL